MTAIYRAARWTLFALLIAPGACSKTPSEGAGNGGSGDEETGGTKATGGGGGKATGGTGGKATGGTGGTGGAGGGSTGGAGGGSTGGAGGGSTGGAGGESTGGAGGGSTGGAGGNPDGGAEGGAPGTGGSSPSAGQLFGSHTFKYPAGAALPTGGQAALDGAVASFYDKWKAAYVKDGCGGVYVRSGGGTGDEVGDEVSEGHGYGMVITPIMAGHDPNAQKTFDGMYAFFRKFPSSHTPDLMGWTVDVGKGCKIPGGGPTDSATDGDLDIAFGLLLADKQWGSKGAINYLAEAKKVIAAIKMLEMHQTAKVPLLGDWAPGDAKYGNSTRPSDFMIDHFRAYGAATGDAFWMGSVDAIHGLVAAIQAKPAMTTGLLPDFVVSVNGTPAPAPGGFLEGDTDGQYGYNSCRVPWRLVTDWVASGDPRAKTEVNKIVGWIKGKTGGDPGKVVDGYTLAGAAGKDTSNDFSFEAPMGVAGIVDKAHQAWVDAAWKRMSTAGVQSYYSDSIRLLSLIVMSGNWWAP